MPSDVCISNRIGLDQRAWPEAGAILHQHKHRPQETRPQETRPQARGLSASRLRRSGTRNLAETVATSQTRSTNCEEHVIRSLTRYMHMIYLLSGQFFPGSPGLGRVSLGCVSLGCDGPSSAMQRESGRMETNPAGPRHPMSWVLYRSCGIHMYIHLLHVTTMMGLLMGVCTLGN